MLLTARFEDALVFATRLHGEQTRKGTQIPYIAHLLAVAAIVLEYGGNEDEAIAALLHDAVEDQGGTEVREIILKRYGEEVVAIVDGCTDTDLFPKPPWRARKEAYIAHLREASAQVRLVASADKLHNARALLADYRQVGELLWSRFHGGREGTLWYYRSVVNTLQEVEPTPLVEELARIVFALEELASDSST